MEGADVGQAGDDPWRLHDYSPRSQSLVHRLYRARAHTEGYVVTPEG